MEPYALLTRTYTRYCHTILTDKHTPSSIYFQQEFIAKEPSEKMQKLPHTKTYQKAFLKASSSGIALSKYLGDEGRQKYAEALLQDGTGRRASRQQSFNLSLAEAKKVGLVASAKHELKVLEEWQSRPGHKPSHKRKAASAFEQSHEHDVDEDDDNDCIYIPPPDNVMIGTQPALHFKAAFEQLKMHSNIDMTNLEEMCRTFMTCLVHTTTWENNSKIETLD